MTAFVTIAEIERGLLHDKPRRRIIIPDVLPAGPCLIYGPSGVGKTGIAIRTGVAVAGGLQWAGRMISRGSVLYVAGEDIEGAKVRLVAAARELGLDPSTLPVAIMEAPADGLVSNSARIAVVGAAQALAKNFNLPIAAVIVDTLAASFGPKSQDDATAASEYMSNADRTARELECAFLSIHHTGKNENSGMRGSRVFFDRADAVVRVNQGKGGVTFVEVEKMRNGPKGARFAYDIAGADLETAGGTISVQVIRQLRALEPATDEEATKEQRKQTIADQMLGVLIRISTNGSTNASNWQDACYEMWPDKSPETRRKVFSKNRRQLIDDGIVSISGENVTVTVTSDAMVTPLVTPQPENVTVTVTTPPSIEGGDSAGRTGSEGNEVPFQKPDRANGEGRSSVLHGEVGRTNVLPRGAGVEDPTMTLRAGDGDGLMGARRASR
ncbi:AAA family ATPase [Aquamicrobium soli]|uniref:AAA family ATPase n=1 Tax=Aquamicrobium soli TaxID=1811518 RepID=A0ABV7KDP6_9HYPH